MSILIISRSTNQIISSTFTLWKCKLTMGSPNVRTIVWKMLGNSYQWQISNCVAKIVQCTPKKVESFHWESHPSGDHASPAAFRTCLRCHFFKVCLRAVSNFHMKLHHASHQSIKIRPSTSKNSSFFAPKSLGFIKFSRKKKPCRPPWNTSKHLPAGRLIPTCGVQVGLRHRALAGGHPHTPQHRRGQRRPWSVPPTRRSRCAPGGRGFWLWKGPVWPCMALFYGMKELRNSQLARISFEVRSQLELLRAITAVGV